MNSDQHFERAVALTRAITGCSRVQAEALINSIGAYISQFNAEIINRNGPAHDFAVNQEN
jgi:hypothetical protein